MAGSNQIRFPLIPFCIQVTKKFKLNADVTLEDSDSVVRSQHYSNAQSGNKLSLFVACIAFNDQRSSEDTTETKWLIMSSPYVEGPSPQGNKKKKIKIDDGRISANSGSLLAGGTRKSWNASPTSGGTPGGASSAASQDAHPYARGSVIEVWHYSRKDDWWSEPDTSDEEQGEGGSHRTARLCDVIDRANVNNAWRYYVHYRDFNRRMDEWIGTERIVSPPSIGNAKARALKKKKQKASLGQGQGPAPLGSPAAAAVAAAVASGAAFTPSNFAAGESDVAGPRSRRRTSLLQDATSSVADDATPGVTSFSTGAEGTTPVPAGSEPAGTGPKAGPGGGGPGGRRRRQSSRRKADDDATVVTSNAADSDAQTGSAASVPSQNQLQPPQLKNNIKSQQIVLSDAMTTHTVGEHVVATVHAQELDEHEGLDEASLREHEEVTKVKNVNFLELGEFQMETWYVVWYGRSPRSTCFARPHSSHNRLRIEQVLLTAAQGALRFKRIPRGAVRVRVHIKHVLSQEGAAALPKPLRAEPEASARKRDLPLRESLHVRGGRPRREDLLPEPLLHRQAVLGSQDALL